MEDQRFHPYSTRSSSKSPTKSKMPSTISRMLPSFLRGQATLPEPPPAPSASEPAPIAVHQLDFPALGMPKYKGRYALVIDNLFTQEDCDRLLKAAESYKDWEVAQINGGSFQYTDTTYRNSSRIMLDDFDLADWILGKLRPYLGEIEHLKVGTRHPRERNKTSPPVKLSRVNERLRFLKYGPGQFFQPHCDGLYVTPDEKEASYYTLQIYINGSKETLKGGATRFWEFGKRGRSGKDIPYIDVEPRMGRVLVFEQALLMHSGEKVLSGTKISMRTEFMYVAEGEASDVDNEERE